MTTLTNNLRTGDKVRYLFRNTWYYGQITSFSDNDVFAIIEWDFDLNLGICTDKLPTFIVERVS